MGYQRSGEDTKAVVTKAFDDAAADYERIGPAFFDRFGRELVARAQLREGMRVLDVGAGTGAVLLPAAELVGAQGRVLGIDLAPGMVERLTSAIAERGLGQAEARLGDAEEPPADDAGWDRILAAQVLFFLPGLEQALARYHRLLRPTGLLAFTSWGPEIPAWTPVYRALYGKIPEGQVPQLVPAGDFFKSDERLTEALTAAGFSEVRHELVTYEIEYDTVDQWLLWTRSHGARAFWEAIPEDRRAESVAAATEALATLRDADGRLRMPISVRYTLASP